MRRNFVAQFIKLLKHCLSDLWSGIVTKNWAHYIDQHWLQALQFSVHLISLLSMLLGCDGSTRIQKAVVDQMGSRPPNSDYDLFFGASLALGSALELLLGPATELIVAGCCIKSTFHCMSQSDREMVCCCCVE